jgi:hypothetical protein
LESLFARILRTYSFLLEKAGVIRTFLDGGNGKTGIHAKFLEWLIAGLFG